MLPTLLPIVLHHGLGGVGDLRFGPLRLSYFNGIDLAIAGQGHPVIITNVHPFGSVEKRAAQMKQSIGRQLAERGLAGSKVILIGHSMGGLDVRYAVSKLGMMSQTAAVVTVSTPHRGSPYADWVIKHFGRRLRGLQLARELGLDIAGVLDCTNERAGAFNEQIRDVPGIPYFSISSARPANRVPLFSKHSHRIIQSVEGDNDGLVSVKSSLWGKTLGTWRADHWHTINRRYVIEWSDPTGDIIPHWLKMLDGVTSQLKI